MVGIVKQPSWPQYSGGYPASSRAPFGTDVNNSVLHSRHEPAKEGYSGHVSRKSPRSTQIPHADCSCASKEVNRHSGSASVQGRSKSERLRSPPKLTSKESSVEGYAGHIPGRGLGNRHLGTALRSAPREEGSSPFGADSKDVLARRVPPCNRFRRELPDRPLPDRVQVNQRNHEDAPKVQVAIPGYSGFIPGKQGENVHGKTSAMSNQLSTEMFGKVREDGDARRQQQANQAQFRQSRRQAQRSTQEASSMGVEQPSVDKIQRSIPGYKGYIPRKKAENIYGITFDTTVKKATK